MYLHFCKECHSFETLRHGVKQCIVAAYRNYNIYTTRNIIMEQVYL
jgi:hypothetical protein